jgi:hypothetical protein
MNVILFHDPAQRKNFIHDGYLHFVGQTKQSTFDECFQQSTCFYVFSKHAVLGWMYVGKARLLRVIQERVNGVPPVYYMRIDARDEEDCMIHELIRIFHLNVSAFKTYLTKIDLFGILEWIPSVGNMKAIVPFTKNSI